MEKSEKTKKEKESETFKKSLENEKTETPKKSESESDLIKGLICGNVNYII